jgi:hypothetical protein
MPERNIMKALWHDLAMAAYAARRERQRCRWLRRGTDCAYEVYFNDGDWRPFS